MSDDNDELAQFLQQSLQNLERLKKQFRHLGPAGERCPRCGDPIETLLNKDGRNPKRCCWRCETAAIERHVREQLLHEGLGGRVRWCVRSRGPEFRMYTALRRGRRGRDGWDADQKRSADDNG